jgi:hypothetical protein
LKALVSAKFSILSPLKSVKSSFFPIQFLEGADVGWFTPGTLYIPQKRKQNLQMWSLYHNCDRTVAASRPLQIYTESANPIGAVNIDKEKSEINSLHSCYDFICKEIFVERLSINQCKSTVQSSEFFLYIFFVLGSYFLKSAVEKSNRLLSLLIRILPHHYCIK